MLGSECWEVSVGTTVGMITCASSKKVYVKSIIAHASGVGTAAIATATGQVYFVPNGSSATSTNRIFDVEVAAGETVLLEPSYPLVLDTSGDALYVGTGNLVGLGATHINFMITGDKEA